MNNITTKADYAAARERLLERIAGGLEKHSAITGAWLSGSLGRGEGDVVSDLDLCLVVEDRYAEKICEYSLRVAGGTTLERRALFERFGEPVNIHENHNNAPDGGSFSAVLYRHPPVIVDWTLVPRAAALRPPGTRLLFTREPIPEGQMLPASAPDFGHADLNPSQRVDERLAFFWMMAMVAAKYIVRGDKAKLDWLMPFMAQNFAGFLNADPDHLAAGPTPMAWLRGFCEKVEEKFPDRSEPRGSVETVLRLK